MKVSERVYVASRAMHYSLIRADGFLLYDYTMASVIERERKRLGLMVFNQHALRHRGVMELPWADCSDDEVASFRGHRRQVSSPAGFD